MPDTISNRTGNHFKFLDSARGIAALMVFGSHFIARNFQEKMNVRYSFFLFNGNDAVSFFFVLSGFVLSYKYIVLGHEMDVRKFYVSRVFRLFPPYFIIVLLSTLYAYRNEFDFATMRDTFIYNKNEFWEEALLFRFHNKRYYPGWTLTLEMLCSFLIPFYIALALKNKKFIPYLIVVTLIIGNNLLFSYLLLFGIVGTTYYHEITSLSFRESKWYKFRYPILAAAVILFSIRQIHGISPLGPTFLYLQDYLGLDFYTYTGLSCFVFLVGILHSKKAQRFLEHKVLVFLGKISYGIYLVHVLVIEVLVSFFGKYLPYPPNPFKFAAFTLLVFGVVVLAATALHYFVELPSIKIGKRIVSKMKPGLIIKRD